MQKETRKIMDMIDLFYANKHLYQKIKKHRENIEKHAKEDEKK